MIQPRVNFADHQATHPASGFCDWLRSSSGPLWGAMVGHRFTQDMANDRLPPDVFIRYLRYEHAFVRTAVIIFGHALVAAPTLADRVRLVGILSSLAGEQEAYFRQRFDALGLATETLPESELPDAALALAEGALAIAAHGTFEAILSTMLAAEWMYHEWCTAAHAAAPQTAGPAEWIALHVRPGFSDQVAWLKERVDLLGPMLDPTRQNRCADNFVRMLRLEIAFHHAPYDGSGSSGAAG